MNKPYPFLNSHLISFLLNLTHTTVRSPGHRAGIGRASAVPFCEESRREPCSGGASAEAAMDPAIQSSLVTALAAIMGSLVGGLASFATTFFTQPCQARRDLLSKGCGES